jgi:hypothetical protein
MGVATTPAAFRASVEARLKKEVGPGRGRAINRRRVLIVMERFIARLNEVLPDSALLKGGLALELRLDVARTTKDIDLRVLGNPEELDAQLRAIESFRPDPEDFLDFKITPDLHHPTVIGEGVTYRGFRFKVKAAIAGKLYAAFGFDVAYGDPILGEPDLLEGTHFFEKYGIPPVRVRTYPATTHLAEKLHAYTLPRGRVNMRLKDLVDMPLIALALDGMTATQLREAFDLTFNFRGTHELPASLPDPPEQWLGPYDRLVAEEELVWPTLEELHAVAAALIDPILAGVGGTWSVAEGRWLEP